jgi:hypothetical protein
VEIVAKPARRYRGEQMTWQCIGHTRTLFSQFSMLSSFIYSRTVETEFSSSVYIAYHQNYHH